MANWLKDEIADFGSTLDRTIQNLGKELHTQRTLTKQDVVELIDYAAARFDKTLDQRITQLKTEASELVDAKVAALRTSLSDAAEEQKRVFLRNAGIAVSSAILVAIVSIFSKKLSNSPLDALAVFRIVLGMLSVGGASSLIYRLYRRYRYFDRSERDLVKVVIHDVGLINPRGAALQGAVLLLLFALWLVLMFWPDIVGL